MFRFMNPSFFMALFFVLGLVLIYWITNKQLGSRLKKSFGPKMLPFFTASFSEKKKTFKFFLSILTLVLMIVALARPQWNHGQQHIRSIGVEMMVVIDVSQSMLSQDVKPSRLEHAKKEVNHLLNILGGDKVGLIAFAGSAILLSPLTTDKSAIRMFLETLSTSAVETQGTELSKALLEAQKALLRGGQRTGPRQRVSQVVVLISDGESHQPGALKVAKELAEQGIHIFTMAFGSEKGGKIPLKDARGFLKGYLKDKNGQEVVTKVNAEVLRQLARSGHGGFYHVTFGGTQMKFLKEDLDKLEKAEFDSLSVKNFDEKFQWPLFFAFLFGWIELFIGTRRKQSDLWEGRFVIRDR